MTHDYRTSIWDKLRAMGVGVEFTRSDPPLPGVVVATLRRGDVQATIVAGYVETDAVDPPLAIDDMAGLQILHGTGGGPSGPSIIKGWNTRSRCEYIRNWLAADRQDDGVARVFWLEPEGDSEWRELVKIVVGWDDGYSNPPIVDRAMVTEITQNEYVPDPKGLVAGISIPSGMNSEQRHTVFFDRPVQPEAASLIPTLLGALDALSSDSDN